MRREVVLGAKRYLSKDGLLVVTARSLSEVVKNAKSNHWESYNDGYISHKTKGMFQRGFTRNALVTTVKKCGFVEKKNLSVPKSSSFVSVAFEIGSI